MWSVSIATTNSNETRRNGIMMNFGIKRVALTFISCLLPVVAVWGAPNNCGENYEQVVLNFDDGECSFTGRLYDILPTDLQGGSSYSLSYDGLTASENPMKVCTYTKTAYMLTIDTNCKKIIIFKSNKMPSCSANDITAEMQSNCKADVSVGTPADIDEGCGLSGVYYRLNTYDLYEQIENGSSFTANFKDGDKVYWMVQDVFGTTGTCSQTIHLTDNTAPQCVASDTTIDVEKDCKADVELAKLKPVITDNCSVQKILFSTDGTNFSDYDPTLVSTYELGNTYTHYWKFYDSNDNLSTCQRNISVKDLSAPACRTVKIVQQVDDVDLDYATITVTQASKPDVQDNCNMVSFAYSLDGESYNDFTGDAQFTHKFKNGDLIYWKGTDSYGHTGYCHQSVLVLPYTSVTYCKNSGIIDIAASDEFSSYTLQITTEKGVGERTELGNKSKLSVLNPDYPALPTKVSVFVPNAGDEEELKGVITYMDVEADFTYAKNDDGTITINGSATTTAAGDGILTYEWRVYPSTYGQDNQPAVGVQTAAAGTSATLTATIKDCGQWVALIVENKGCCQDTVMHYVCGNAPVCTGAAATQIVDGEADITATVNLGTATNDCDLESITYKIGSGAEKLAKIGTGSIYITDVFPYGESVVTWSVASSCGNSSATCQTTVRVEPVFGFECKNYALKADVVSEIPLPTFKHGTASDYEWTISPSQYYVSGNVIKGDFPVGKTTVTVTAAKDGLSTTCLQSVIVYEPDDVCK